MYILGISGLYHDSAAALIKDGKVISAVQEERFSRIKNDRSFPKRAIEYCLKSNNVTPSELQAVVFYDNPLFTLERFVKNCVNIYPDSMEMIESHYEMIFGERMWIHRTVKNKLGSMGINNKMLICRHHLSHAASAFYVSPFKKAAVLVVDAVGEWATTSLGYCEDKSITMLKQIDYPDSVGLLYSAFTYFCGFKVNSGEYKLMGLAPYGKPVYADLIKSELVRIEDDGSFKLNLDYFEFQFGRYMVGEKFEELFGCKRRNSDEHFNQKHLDLAASIQAVTEEIILKIAGYLRQLTDCENLCLSGGVALNCVANGLLKRKKIFKNIFIQPASGDAGGAVGAALYAYYCRFGKERIIDKEAFDPYLGPSFSSGYIENVLNGFNAVYRHEDDAVLLPKVARLIAEGKVVGFFNGKMEFGPRALGNRSILADPRDKEMQVKLNQKIKFRESFRPFAPAVMAEYAAEYFDIDTESPYMLMTAPVQQKYRQKTDGNSADIFSRLKEERSLLPAVTHVDYSARVQTVSVNNNRRFYELLNCFYKLTGYAVLVNTSFNVRGEPIVCTPQDAYSCFMRTEMDVLVMENFLLYKNEQPHNPERWEKAFEKD